MFFVLLKEKIIIYINSKCIISLINSKFLKEILLNVKIKKIKINININIKEIETFKCIINDFHFLDLYIFDILTN